MIKLKTQKEIEIMVQGGRIASLVLKKAMQKVSVGVTTRELDELIDLSIKEQGAQASFKTVDGYNNASCINVNEGIVHGMPSDYKLKIGDVVSIDLGVLYEKFHTDLSYTLEVETQKEKEFLNIGKIALEKAIKKCRLGNKLGDISSTMQSEVESKGYSVSRDLVGHGIGKELHEDPYVLCYGKPNTGHRLKERMVLAVEVIYQKGNFELSLADDDWTLETADKSLSGLFEKTVAVTKNGPLVITSFD